MNAVLVLSLCGIGLTFVSSQEGSACEVIKGSIKIRRKIIEDVESAEICAEACNPAKECILWEYKNKAKLCKIIVTRVKDSKKTSSGINCKLPGGEVFERSSPIIKTKDVEDIASAEMCASECESRKNCLTWKYGKRGCRITRFKSKQNKKTSFGFPTTTPPPVTTPPFVCPDDWSEYKGSCYKHFGNWTQGGGNWTTARDKCASYGGDLASIHNSDEWDHVTINMRQNDFFFWIGGLYNATTAEWKWSDGSSFDYANWMNGVAEWRNCLYSGWEIQYQWSGRKCDFTTSFLCKIQKWLRIDSNPVDINQFRSHTGKKNSA